MPCGYCSAARIFTDSFGIVDYSFVEVYTRCTSEKDMLVPSRAFIAPK